MRFLTTLLLMLILSICCGRTDTQRNAEIDEYWQRRMNNLKSLQIAVVDY